MRKRRIKYVNVERMNSILGAFRDAPKYIIWRAPKEHEPISPYCFINETKTELQVTACFGISITFILKLDGSERLDNITGLTAYTTMAKYAKPQKCKDYGIDPDSLGSATGILYKNEAFAGKRVKAYSYDINSAFSAQMLQPLPDLRKCRKNTVVLFNQVGFVHVENNALGATKSLLMPVYKPGTRAEFVFPLMESPYKRFVETWYSRKKNAKTKQEKAKAKMMLNACIGYLQKTNPFWRSVIINRCNKVIKDLIDENTLYCNTDCIVSAVKRPDIELLAGNELGQFKIEHQNEDFAWAKDSMIYQWGTNTPVARGIPKEWFKVQEELLGRPFDLLTDKLPYNLNRFCFDKNAIIIKEIEYENYNK